MVPIASATVGVVRRRYAGRPGIRYASRSCEKFTRFSSSSRILLAGCSNAACARWGLPTGAPPRSGNVELEPGLAQRVGHAVRAPLAVGPEPGERVEERAAAVVDAVAEDVQVLPLAVDRRELRRRDQAEAASRRRLERLVDAVHRVMVGEREQLHARGVRRRDHGRRR